MCAEARSVASPTGGESPSGESPGGESLDVVAVGNALLDVLVHSSESQISALGLARGTMALVDLDQAAFIYGQVGPATEVSGGSAANTAVGVASLGGSAGYLGKVGPDALGEVFVRDISAAGVVLGPNTLDRGAHGEAQDMATGRCIVLVSEDGERTMATHLGVASKLAPDDVDENLVSRASVVYLEGYLWDQEDAKQAMRKAMELAHKHDALVAMSLSDPFCVERHRREFLDLVRGEIDLLFANEEEVTLLFGAKSLESAVQAVGETGMLAALTIGAGGSVVVATDVTTQVPAHPVDEVVDTTGAGDLYAAGFIYGLTHGRDPEACAHLGSLCASEVISHIGARPQSDLRELVRRFGFD